MNGDLGVRLRRIYLRLSVTDRCNLRCWYCLPAKRSPPTSAATASDAELRALLGQIHAEYPIYKLRLTGGEPLLRQGLANLLTTLRRHELPNTEFALTTNGLLLKRDAGDLYAAGLRALTISIDTLDAEKCAELTRSRQQKLTAILDGIEAARVAGFKKLKLNAVLLRSFNGDQLVELLRFAAGLDAELRFIELMPFGEGAALHHAEFMATSEALDLLSTAFPYRGKIPASPTSERHHFLVAGKTVPVGFIRTMSAPFCDTCDRIRLDSQGRLFPCLRSETGVELLPLLRAGKPQLLRQEIRASILSKSTPDTTWPIRSMATIGG